MLVDRILKLDNLLKRNLLLSILLFFLVESVNAQSYIHYTTANGLPSNELYNGLQDDVGFILINSANGLIRFDGTRFKLFNVEDGLPDNEIIHSQIDDRGRVWLSPVYGGQCLYQNGKIQNASNNGLLQSLVDSINTTTYMIDGTSSKGNILFFQPGIRESGKGIVYKVVDSTIDIIDSKLIDGIVGLIESDDGLYCFGKDSLCWLKNKKILKKRTYNAGRGVNVFNFKFYHGYYYALTTSVKGENVALMKFKLKGGALTDISKVTLFNSANTITDLVIKKDIIYVSLNHRIEKYSLGLEQLPLFHSFKETTRIHGLFFDRQESLWVITQNNGIYLFSGASKIVNPNKLKFDNFYASNNNTFYFKDNELVHINSTGRSRRHKLSFRIDGPMGFKANSEYIFWLGSDKVLKRYNLKNKKLERLGFQLGGRSIKGFDTKQGLWTVASHADLAICNTNGTVQIIDERATAVKIDKSGQIIYKGTIEGLKTYQIQAEGNWVEIITDKKLNRRVLQLEQDTLGVLWVLQQDQIIAYYNGKVIGALNKFSGLVGRTLNHISLSGGNILVSTNSGVSVVSYRLVEDSLHVKSIINYTKENGLSESFIKKAAIFDSILVVKTNQGVQYIPLAQSNNTSSYRPRIVAFRANGEEIVLDSLCLNRKQNFISIDFASLLYGVQPPNYAYRLKEQGAKWQFTSSRTCDFLDLQPGSYTFQLKAVYNNGSSYGQMESLIFEIEPAFWQTAWFKFLVVIFILLLIAYFVFRWFKRRETKLHSERHFAQLKMQALRAQMNPHFIFNSLNSIQSIVNSGDIDLSNKYIVQFSKLIRLSLNYSSKDYIALKDEIDFLHNYLQLEQLRFKDSFSYEINCAQNVNISVTFLPPMFLQIYIENAIKHGVAPLKSGGKITIDFEKLHNCLVCSIEDNGVGRKQSFESNHKVYPSKGTQLNEDRVGVYNTLTGDEIQIDWQDKINSSGESSGTLIKIKIPIA